MEWQPFFRAMAWVGWLAFVVVLSAGCFRVARPSRAITSETARGDLGCGEVAIEIPDKDHAIARGCGRVAVYRVDCSRHEGGDTKRCGVRLYSLDGELRCEAR